MVDGIGQAVSFEDNFNRCVVMVAIMNDSVRLENPTPAKPTLARLSEVSATMWSLVVVAIAFIIRVVAPLTTDTDWLMTNCRRFLDGAVLYKDIVETNPPMAIFMHLPAALVERWTGLPAEPVFTAMVFAAALGSAAIFSRCVLAVAPYLRLVLPLTLAILLIAPLSTFDEREQVALILTLPILGVALLRVHGHQVPWLMIVLSGLAAGVAPMIKPHFALGIVGPYVALAVLQRKPWLVLSPEAVIAAAMTVAYGVATMVFMPAYGHDVVPLLLDLYRPMKKPFWYMLFLVPTLAWLIAVAALWLATRRRFLTPLNIIILAASAGYLLGFIDQGRGWAYQMYPALSTLMLVVFTVAPAELTSGVPLRRVPALAAVIAVLSTLGYSTIFGALGLGVVAPIRAEVAHPTMMSITFDLTPGHPIVTQTHGTWVGTFSSRWVTVNAAFLASKTHDPAKLARYRQWLAYDRAVANRDLAKRPDIVLVGLSSFDWPGWIQKDPETRRLMADYVLLSEDRLSVQKRKDFEGVQAWIRKDLVRSQDRR